MVLFYQYYYSKLAELSSHFLLETLILAQYANANFSSICIPGQPGCHFLALFSDTAQCLLCLIPAQRRVTESDRRPGH